MERYVGKYAKNSPIPLRAGIGLRAPHYREILSTLPKLGWLEVHSENYFGDGGQPLRILESLRHHYPISLHGVGLSLGSTDPLDQLHILKLKSLIDRIEPGLVSEHLSWGSVGGRNLNALLPLPFNDESLEYICDRIDLVQNLIGRQILVENISSYLEFKSSTLSEWEFIARAAEKSGCGILLDINNIYVNSVNHGFDTLEYIKTIPPAFVHEIHLAGFEDNGQCLMDTHSRPVSKEVWALYRQAIKHLGRIPTLIEWDTDLPELAVLLNEARQAQQLLDAHDGILA